MDAVEFLKSYRKICDSNTCTKCPLWVDEHYACMMDAKVADKTRLDESKIVSAAEQWAKEHPVKTRQSEFLKIVPNAITKDGVLTISPCKIDRNYSNLDKCRMFCLNCRRDYWLQEVE